LRKLDHPKCKGVHPQPVRSRRYLQVHVQFGSMRTTLGFIAVSGSATKNRMRVWAFSSNVQRVIQPAKMGICARSLASESQSEGRGTMCTAMPRFRYCRPGFPIIELPLASTKTLHFTETGLKSCAEPSRPSSASVPEPWRTNSPAVGSGGRHTSSEDARPTTL